MREATTEIWKRFEIGQEHHRRLGLYEKSARAYRFFLGDQWYGMSEAGRELPVMNIVAPTIKNKVATVAQGQVSIHYLPIGGAGAARAESAALCERLGELAASNWERFKMDSLCWQVVKNAAITGESYLYFYDEDGRAEVLENTSVYLGDEQCRDLQKQPYILIAERRRVREVREFARRCGVDDAEVERIVGDREVELLPSEQARGEVADGEGKVTVVLCLEKDERGIVHLSRATRQVVVQPDTALYQTDHRGRVLGGVELYPLAGFVWNRVPGSARGAGEAEALIANQLEINKTLARRAVAVKTFAFPRLIYDRDRLENPEALDEVGAPVAVENLGGGSVGEMISYLSPSPISGAAEALSNELVQLTRELAGAGDAAVGSVNPEKASGAAILAVRDLAQLPLSEQAADFRQFCEDVAAIWLERWRLYHPEGVLVTDREGEQSLLSAEALAGLSAGIRVEVSSQSPYSLYAEQQALDNLFSAGALSFEEYVSLLSPSAALPKAKLEEVLRARRAFENIAGPTA